MYYNRPHDQGDNDMSQIYKILEITIAWVFIFGATCLVWIKLGTLSGLVFYLLLAGLTGALGAFVVKKAAEVSGINSDNSIFS
jgi:multisubunit Na+/H+ antiporter MnhG subunit